MKFQHEFQMPITDSMRSGWLALSTDLQMQIVGGIPGLSEFVHSGLSTGRFALYPEPLRTVVEKELHLCDHSGHAVSPAGIYWSWQRGAMQQLMVAATEKTYILEDVCVELPNHTRTSRYLDIHSLLNDSELCPFLTDLAYREINRIAPDIIVTYSSVVRRFCSELLRSRIANCIQVNLPTPYAVASNIASLRHYRLQKALVFADIIDTGSHVSRVVRGCATMGMNVLSVLGILDTHAEGQDPKTEVQYTALLRFANTPSNKESKVTHRVDHYTLCLHSANEAPSDRVPSPRDRLRADEFYSMVTRQKAVINHHCSNQAGHHFVVAIDFHQLARKDILNHLVHKLRPLAKGCKLMVVPLESVLSEIAENIADKLDLHHDNIVWAVASRRVVREHRFSASDTAKIRTVGSSGGRLLFLDDAIHHGESLNDIAEYVAHCGVKRLHAWFILDNRPPGAAAIQKVQFDNAPELEISHGSLLRSFFPAFSTSLSCPYCRVAESYHRAIQSRPNSLVKEQMSARLAEMRPVDLSAMVLDPWRHSASQTIPVPQIVAFRGMPMSVGSPDVLTLALWELSQYEEGIEAVLRVFHERSLREYDQPIAYVLSKNMANIEKLGLRREYVSTFESIVQEWREDNCAGLFETALLWPIEVLADEIPQFLDNVNDAMLGSDSFIAILYALIQRTLAGCRDTDRDRIVEALRNVERRAHKEYTTYGLIRSVVASFTKETDSDWEMLWALRSLAQRMLVHRDPSHRIQTQIPNLVASLSADRIQEVLGLDSDVTSIESFAIFYYLAEVGQAVDILVRGGDLKKSATVERLLTGIQTVMQHRAELRQSWRRGQAPNLQYIERELKSIKEYLSEIGILLNSEDPTDGVVELKTLLENRILKAYDGFILPLYKDLRAGKLVNINDDFEEISKNLMILADPALLLRLVKSVATNVQKHGEWRELMDAVDIDGVVTKDGGVEVFVGNPCHDRDAVRRFHRGRDYHSLSSALYRFGATYSGAYQDGVFTTQIRFSSVI